MIFRVTANSKLETGKLVSPDGVPFVGFKLTFTDSGGVPMDELNYDDINAIIHSNPDKVYIKEEKTVDGKFKSLHGSTEPF